MNPSLLENEIPVEERLILALDVPTVGEARALVDDLGETVRFYKIGLQLIFAGGLEFARELVAEDKKVFLDAKLLDIDQTVTNAVRNIALMGVTFLTVHGEKRCVQAAVEGARGTDLDILAVTVLTSLDAGDLRDARISYPVEELVLHRAGAALEAGAHGVIASGREAASIRAMADDRLTIITPGVRSAGSAADDQKRVVTPGQAMASGADYIVVGRQILRADDPKAEAEKIIEEIRHGLGM
ncbi:MAG: orotidine-5'-phosphate decarboxylase [Sphingomonadales bacterium]